MTELPTRPLPASLAMFGLSCVPYGVALPVRLWLDQYAGPLLPDEYWLFRRPNWKAIRYPTIYTGTAESAAAIDRENRWSRYRHGDR